MPPPPREGIKMHVAILLICSVLWHRVSTMGQGSRSGFTSHPHPWLLLLPFCSEDSKPRSCGNAG